MWRGQMKSIIDDCIDKSYQNTVEDTLRFNTDFRWVYHDNLVEDGDHQLIGFSHMFILNGESCSDFSGLLMPLVYEACDNAKLNISKVLRARCFLQTPGVREHEYDQMHVDIPDFHNVCLYYVNDSDGDTYFSEKMYGDPVGEYVINTTVSPKNGRCVFFDGLRFHASSKPTQNSRFVINYNFIP